MIFKGTATALITPFTEDDKVDEKALCNIVEHQIASGVNALVALGTTAETATLSEEEKKQKRSREKERRKVCRNSRKR